MFKSCLSHDPRDSAGGTFSFLACRGDRVAMLSTHRSPESLVSPLFLKTEFLASVDRQF